MIYLFDFFVWKWQFEHQETGTSMETKKSANKAFKKAKATVYMTEEDETLLNEIFIKRIRDRKKTDKSTLLCEGIRLLYEKEIGASSNA